jgi:hypothetical protein
MPQKNGEEESPLENYIEIPNKDMAKVDAI